MIVVFSGDADELERRLDHARRGVAVAVHDAVGQRAVIGANPHCDALLLALEHQGCEALLDALDLGGVVLVRVFADAKELLVGEVARVDAHFLDVLGSFHGRGWAEMDVGYERRLYAHTAQPAFDLADRFGVGHGRRGDAHDLTAGVHQAQRLGQRRLDVLRARGSHGLNANGLVTAHGDSTDLDFARSAALIRETTCRVGQ